MKKNNLLLATSLLVFLFTASIAVAQINNVGKIISTGTGDASKILGAYLKPYANAFGADLNGGWYNTAKVHKTLGFDLTLTISTAFVPSADKTYDVSQLGLSSGATVTGNSMAPTVAGKNDVGPNLKYTTLAGATPITLASFNTPRGTGIGYIPAPMLQLGIGVVKGTDIIGRFVPKVDIGDFGSVSAWGIGLKHSIKQWIPGIKMAPFFHLSFLGGYTQFHATANLNLPKSYYTDLNPGITDGTGSTKFDNQKMDMQVNGLTLNILASFDLPVVTFYGGVGISNTKTTLKLQGNYPIIDVVGTNASIGSITDPLNIEMKSMSGGKTKPRLNAGIKFKLAVITIHFDYTYANYSVATFGLGISVR
jgi:hypothetical protein